MEGLSGRIMSTRLLGWPPSELRLRSLVADLVRALQRRYFGSIKVMMFVRSSNQSRGSFRSVFLVSSISCTAARLHGCTAAHVSGVSTRQDHICNHRCEQHNKQSATTPRDDIFGRAILSQLLIELVEGRPNGYINAHHPRRDNTFHYHHNNSSTKQLNKLFSSFFFNFPFFPICSF